MPTAPRSRSPNSWRIADASHAELKAATSWLSNADKATATYSVPRRKDVTDKSAVNDDQTITFALTVTDGDGETATDTVTATIQGSTWMVAAPEIDVQGNGVTIPDNDTTPGTADRTDFGPALRTGGRVSRTFTIRNTGLRALVLTGTPKVAVSGANAGDFTVTAQPSSPVAALSGTTTFTVEFDPSGQGGCTATLSIANDDSNENPYNFDIKGRAVNLVLTFIGEATNQTATEDEAFTYTAPAATVLDSSASLTYTAALTNGDDLPGWLTFTDSTRTFSGTPGEADAPATLNVRVTVTAGDMIDTTDFVLTVEETVSTLPTANAGADQIGKRGGTVTLAGAGTLNADGSQEPLTYNWRIVDASHAELKAATSWLSNGDQATATYSVPRRKDVIDKSAVNNRQWITFELTVTDGDGETATDTVTVTILGSTWTVLNLSVASATAEETSGAIAFTVSLSAAARDPVTVNYDTGNGTALAGVDYTAASGTLTFQPGQTSKTVTVAILGDEIDEGSETFTFTLSDPLPARTVTLANATATGTIENEDPLLNDWLSRFGRSVASQTMLAVAERLALPPEAGSHLILAGQPVKPEGSAADAAATDGTATDRLAGLLQGTAPMVGAMTGRDLLLTSNFHLASGDSATDPASPSPWRFAGWGQAGMERFENRNGGLPVDADVLTGVLGADMARGPWLAGAALSISRGDGEMRPRGVTRTYDLESTMTAINPYLRIRPSQRFSAWGMAGWGWGHLTLTHQQEDNGDSHTYNTDLAMTLAAFGGRAELLTPAANGGFALALKGDAFFVRTRSEAVEVDGLGRLAAAEGEASRLRLVLEGSRPVTLASGAVLTPSLEMGVRQDGGDAETGTGLEVGAALAYDHPSSGMSADLKARTLLVHADSGYREWGVSGALRLAPGDGNRGLSFSLLPAWGREGGGADQLWTARDAVAVAAGGDGFEPTARLAAEVGYGLPAFSDRFTGTPYVGLGWADATRSYRIGWRLTPVEDADNFQFSLEAQRRQSASQEDAEHRLGFNINTLW